MFFVYFFSLSLDRVVYRYLDDSEASWYSWRVTITLSLVDRGELPSKAKSKRLFWDVRTLEKDHFLGAVMSKSCPSSPPPSSSNLTGDLGSPESFLRKPHLHIGLFD